MTPTAAVSGWYFSHPEARYFGVGRLDRDQVADYARRKGWTLAEAEKWLAPNLGYEVEGSGDRVDALCCAMLCTETEGPSAYSGV